MYEKFFPKPTPEFPKNNGKQSNFMKRFGYFCKGVPGFQIPIIPSILMIQFHRMKNNEFREDDTTKQIEKEVKLEYLEERAKIVKKIKYTLKREKKSATKKENEITELLRNLNVKAKSVKTMTKGFYRHPGRIETTLEMPDTENGPHIRKQKRTFRLTECDLRKIST